MKLVVDAIAFDFDGTILDSNHVKGSCFNKLFAKFGLEAALFAEKYHNSNLGQPRSEKISEIVRILQIDLGDEELSALIDEFSTCAESKVLDSRFVPGFEDFFSSVKSGLPLYICSATPQRELERIVEGIGLSLFFRAVYGYPTTKELALRQIALENKCDSSKVLMIGDAESDRYAAMIANTQFVSVGSDSEMAYEQLSLMLGRPR